MSDTSKLVAYLRRFECRDRDGNYWSPQEILEAADRLEQLQGYVTTDAEEIHAKDDRIKQLEAENERLRDAMERWSNAVGWKTCECRACQEFRKAVTNDQ